MTSRHGRAPCGPAAQVGADLRTGPAVPVARTANRLAPSGVRHRDNPLNGRGMHASPEAPRQQPGLTGNSNGRSAEMGNALAARVAQEAATLLFAAPLTGGET